VAEGAVKILAFEAAMLVSRFPFSIGQNREKP